MKIYHYSSADYATLKTLKKQNEDSTSAVVLPDYVRGDYGSHISFFLDPAPLDILGSIFGKDHRVWFPGSKLVEYTVDVVGIGKFRYELVETPEKTELYYNEDISNVEYHRRLDTVNRELAYVGSGSAVFIQASKHLVGGTRKAYEKLPFRPNWKQIRSKYAATVPHVMLYPTSGEVAYQSKKHVHVK